jgi:hypothetical protein
VREDGVAAIGYEARRQLVDRALQAGSDDRRPFPWRGGEQTWPVVSIPAAYLLLNPDSHRIKAEIAALGPRSRVIGDDPFGEEAQDLIAEIIRGTDGFADVKTALRDGQRDPGVITRVGVIINGNTRTVAMRELHGADAYVKVHVLPEDATLTELTRLELRFQMQKDVKQEYTFTNQLLLIDDLMRQGSSPEDIGLDLYPGLDPASRADRNKAREDVEGEARLLALIRQVLDASGGRMTFSQFNKDRQTLLEIDQAYSAIERRTHNTALARRVRDAKLTAMVIGLGYNDVRQIDEGFLDQYAMDAFLEEPDLRALAPGLLSEQARAGDDALDGLDFLDDEPVSDEVTLQPVFEALVSTGPDGTVTLAGSDGGGTDMPAEVFRASVRSALERGVNIKRLDNDRAGALTSPMRQLNIAAASLDRARARLGEVAGHPGFDIGALREAVRKLQRAYDETGDALRAQAGISWEDTSR